MTTIRLSVPDSAAKDEIIEIKAMIQHEMESGYRLNMRGQYIPRDIITLFECFFGDELVFSSDFHPGVAANPFLTFYARATTSGTFLFRWTDQNGNEWSDTADITVV